MTRISKLVATATFVGLVAVAALPTVAVGATAQDNDAIAVNEKDGKSVFKLAFKVKRTMDSDVDANNTAIAYASCTDCRTVAAAIQVVLLMEDPESINAENTAVAINYDCTECETLAAAYQFVFGYGEPVKFTAEGNRKLADIKRRLHELKKRDDLTLQQLANEVAKLAAETADVVAQETVPTGTEGAPGQQEETTTTTVAEETETTAAPTTTTTQSPAPSDETADTTTPPTSAP